MEVGAGIDGGGGGGAAAAGECDCKARWWSLLVRRGPGDDHRSLWVLDAGDGCGCAGWRRVGGGCGGDGGAVGGGGNPGRGACWSGSLGLGHRGRVGCPWCMGGFYGHGHSCLIYWVPDMGRQVEIKQTLINTNTGH